MSFVAAPPPRRDDTLGAMSILMGWREQYERMLRSHGRFAALALGYETASSDEARDAVFHFFQDAYHLKDWIKNDPKVAGVADPEGLVNGSPELSLCADLCNGTKHGGLDAM